MSRSPLPRTALVLCLVMVACTTWWHGALLPGYEGLVLEARSGKGAESLRLESDFDPTLAQWIREHGAPDYIHVASGSVVELCYVAQDQLVTFSRGLTAPSSASVTTPIPLRLSERFVPVDRQRLSSLRASLPSVPRPKPKRAAPAASESVPANAAFDLDERDEPYRKDLLRMVDKIRRENTRCASAESVTRSLSKAPSDPVWFVTCRDAQGTAFKVFFSRSDIRSGKRMRAPARITKDDALERCKSSVRSQPQFRDMVAFTWFDTKIQEQRDGRTSVTTSFRTKPSSGRSETFHLSCLMNAGDLFEAQIKP